MATLLNAVTTATTGDWEAMTAPCTVYVKRTAPRAGTVTIEIKSANTSEQTIKKVVGNDVFSVDADGAYSIRASTSQASGAVTVEAIASA